MKINILIKIIAVFLCLIGVFFGGRLYEKAEFLPQGSLMRGTLDGLRKALEHEKDKTGKYPENLKSLDGASFEDGDYSRKLAESALYIRTETGYVLILGNPSFIFIDQTGAIHNWPEKL
jgi:hypothetical protein